MNGSWNGGLVRFAGFAVAVLALMAALALAVVFAAAVVVTAVVASILIALTAVAMRARRTVRVRSAPSDLIEARRVGHTWVAYGWNERR
ncbi:MAG: hypothetical protein KY446_02530 [Proteobacteria bacterium]|nr:hypothetical protein [Pseudomonadota bacterium]MBW3616617.1 hypothetical protein [Pseudomonadota bacterium]